MGPNGNAPRAAEVFVPSNSAAGVRTDWGFSFTVRRSWSLESRSQHRMKGIVVSVSPPPQLGHQHDGSVDPQRGVSHADCARLRSSNLAQQLTYTVVPYTDRVCLSRV